MKIPAMQAAPAIAPTDMPALAPEFIFSGFGVVVEEVVEPEAVKFVTSDVLEIRRIELRNAVTFSHIKNIKANSLAMEA